MISFHRLLIGTAIFFTAGFGVWMLGRYRSVGGAGYLVLGIGFVLASVGLIYYLRNLRRFLGK